jgi:hypothetical protein
VILTDRLRIGKGIRLERLIPYSHSFLLQGNIHHIATGGGSDGNIVHSGEEVGYVLDGEIKSSPLTAAAIVPRLGTLFTSVRSCRMVTATSAPSRRA